MRRALEATELTDLGIIFLLFGGSGFRAEALADCDPVKLECGLEDQHFFDPLHIDVVDDGEMVEVSLLLLGLLREDVAVVSVLPLDLSRSGKREALFGTGVGFELCHLLNN